MGNGDNGVAAVVGVCATMGMDGGAVGVGGGGGGGGRERCDRSGDAAVEGYGCITTAAMHDALSCPAALAASPLGV
jgi:hypothetical protein